MGLQVAISGFYEVVMATYVGFWWQGNLETGGFLFTNEQERIEDARRGILT